MPYGQYGPPHYPPFWYYGMPPPSPHASPSHPQYPGMTQPQSSPARHPFMSAAATGPGPHLAWGPREAWGPCSNATVDTAATVAPVTRPTSGGAELPGQGDAPSPDVMALSMVDESFRM